MKDKLGDLIPWLEKLLQSLAKVNPDDDPEEVERRSQSARFISRLTYLAHTRLTLCRSLEDIVKRSLTPSEKSKVARVLDKTQDLQEVIGLVENLRQVVLIYQVSVRHRRNRRLFTRGAGVTTTVNIQPGRPFDRELLIPVSIFEAQRSGCRFKGSFDVLLKLHQVGQHAHQPIYFVTHLQPLPVKTKIESVRARLDRLGVGGGATGNANEFNRRKSLFECVLDTLRRPSALMRSQSSRGDQRQVATPVRTTWCR